MKKIREKVCEIFEKSNGDLVELLEAVRDNLDLIESKEIERMRELLTYYSIAPEDRLADSMSKMDVVLNYTKFTS